MEHISAATYSAIVDDLTSVETIMLDGRWPISVGRSAHYGHIMIGHVQDRFIIVTLDPVPDPDPDWAARPLTMNPEAFQ
ncbi:hypothetical protein GXW78_24015 [Roseomonas terrae]|uniref:Uncharacterized protein n=1 Tax=Neoroseomonas terrae TaxID=424799 RepID=A0ABS5ENY6_9PROT|nr:hypothetical protein [Neoroseomonas terrae]MBR0652744.1 hypothetical protein [Neoroseomonas terrae]